MINKKYPKVNYIGNKEKISSWICDLFPPDVNSVFDAFSGGASLSFEAKIRGYRVFSNDVLKVNYHLANSLIQNADEHLDDSDLEHIFSGKPIKGFMWKHYKNVHFFEEECKALDQYRKNILELKTPIKISIAFSLMRRAMIRKMPYSRFTIPWETVKLLRDEEYSYEKYGRRRGYHNLSFEQLFLDNLNGFQDSFFDNGKENLVYNGDVFNIINEVTADLIYLDPPYGGTMNNYFGFYGMIDEYIDGERKSPYPNDFINKNNSLHLLEKLFSKLTNFKYWYLSYNNRAYPDKETLKSMLLKHAQKVTVIEREHNYKITGKENKNKNIEYLFIVENDRNPSHAGSHQKG